MGGRKRGESTRAPPVVAVVAAAAVAGEDAGERAIRQGTVCTRRGWIARLYDVYGVAVEL